MIIALFYRHFHLNSDTTRQTEASVFNFKFIEYDRCMNKKYLLILLLVLAPYRLWSSEDTVTADESNSLPCLKVSSGCRKFIKDNKSATLSTTQQCIDEVLQGKEIKGLEIPRESILDCKKVRSQLKTK